MPFDFVAHTRQLNALIADMPFGEAPAELYEPLSYLMGLGGKRLRPLLVLLGHHLYADNHDPVLRPAVAVEVFHNFTLMHDDIMDEAPLRRGLPTVHEKWNRNVAILAGDVMLVKAYELLMTLPDAHLRTALALFNRCATEVCEGQQLDMNFESRATVTEGEYLEMIRLKTAVLLGFALELGGLVGGADATDRALLRQVGVSLGIGFQLKDDLLDVYGEQAKVGKQVGGDIIANKKTFLLIRALAEAQGATAQHLHDWLTRPAFDKAEKVAAVRAIYDELAIGPQTEALMRAHFARGFEALDTLQADPDRRATLRTFAERLIERDN